MPQTDLRVAAIPIDIRQADPSANLAEISARIAEVAGQADIAILPEMCTSGYTVDPALASAFAASADGPEIVALRALAAAHDMAIAGSVAFRADDGRLFNRAFIFTPDGNATLYDKHHLFVLGREPELYTPGQTLPPTLLFRGWRIKIAVCYDLRFPLWTRWRADDPYDILIFPANWPTVRRQAWDILLRARAIENQAAVVGVDRLGSDPYGDYAEDMTVILNHWGTAIGERLPSGTILATLSGETLERDRRRFPNLAVADPFTILTLD